MTAGQGFEQKTARGNWFGQEELLYIILIYLKKKCSLLETKQTKKRQCDDLLNMVIAMGFSPIFKGIELTSQHCLFTGNRITGILPFRDKAHKEQKESQKIEALCFPVHRRHA